MRVTPSEIILKSSAVYRLRAARGEARNRIIHT